MPSGCFAPLFAGIFVVSLIPKRLSRRSEVKMRSFCQSQGACAHHPFGSKLGRALRIETLEARQLLAADLFYENANLDLELMRAGDQIQIVDANDNSLVLREVAIGEIDRQIEIIGRSVRIDSAVQLDDNSLIVSAGRIDFYDAELTTTGSVMLTAEHQPGSLVDNVLPSVLSGVVNDREQSVVITGSSLTAASFSIVASGEATAEWGDLGGHQSGVGQELIAELERRPNEIGLTSIGLASIGPLTAQAKLYTASATIQLHDSIINSTTTVDVWAQAEADASLNTIAVTGLNAEGSPATLSVGLSHSETQAIIDVSGTTQIIAGGRVHLLTDAKSTAVNVARNEADSRARAPGAAEVDYGFNLAMAFTRETSTIDVSVDSSIYSDGSIDIQASGTVNNDAKATTAIFNDGTFGASAAVGVDRAIVRAEVYGTLTSSGSERAQVDLEGWELYSGRESLILKGIHPDNPIRVGDRLSYHSSQPRLGLIDGQDYFVHEITEQTPQADGLLWQTIRLTRAQSIDLDNSGVDPNAEHSLTRLGVLRFDATQVAPDGSGEGRIELSLPAGVTRLTYLGPEADADDNLPDAITGLEQNQTYEAVPFGADIKLRLPGETNFINFSLPAGTSGTHGFRYDAKVQSFSPVSDVDSNGNWIALPEGHGLKTGDFLLYGTDPTKAVTREMYSFDEQGNVLGRLGEITLPDAPIDGLNNHHGYYAVVDRVLPNRLRLAGSLADALASRIVDLTSALGTTHSFLRHGTGGISVTAEMQATNKAEAGTNFTDGEQPWSSVLSGVAQGHIENVGGAALGFFGALTTGIQGNGISTATELTSVDADPVQDPNSSKQGGVDAAASFVLSVSDHQVHAIIGATATLRSETDITVDAEIVQWTRLGAISESTRAGLNESSGDSGSSQSSKEFAVSGGYGLYRNEAHAIIDDAFVDELGETQRARLDARNAVIVDSRVVYPFLGNTDGGVNAAVTIDQFGLGGFSSLLDGTHGLAGLVNVYARTTADGGRNALALALGIMVTDTTNAVVSRIGDGAWVQTDSYFPAADQRVAVGAVLDTFNVGAGQMSSLNLSIPGFAEAFQLSGKRGEDGSLQDFLKDIADPLGVSGKNAAGGAMLLTLGDHTTVAEIAKDVQIGPTLGPTTGRINRLDVTATSDIYDLALVQTGTASSQFGFSAAIAAANIKTDTRASVDATRVANADGTVPPAARLAAETLNIAASDTLDRVNILGAFLKGKQIGVGTSIGVNVIDQQVAAFIGRDDRGLFGTRRMNVDLGAVSVVAKADGDIHSWVISGGLQGIGASSGKANTKQTGAISLNVPVAINQVNSRVEAYADALWNETEFATVAELDVNAASEIDVQAVAIGASFVVQAGEGAAAGKLNLAGAGAVAVNTVVTDVHASLSSSWLLGSKVTVQASDGSTTEADAGGFALVAALSPQSRAALSFGVSVALNDVSGTVEASVERVSYGPLDENAEGDFSVVAESMSITRALAIAGGGAANLGNGSFGGAGAAAQNAVAKEVRAEVADNSRLTLPTGTLRVAAYDESQVLADAGGVGIGVTAGPGNGISGALGISLAFNDVANVVTASIGSNSSAFATLIAAIEVEAEAKTSIEALAIAASAGVAGSAGLAVALAGAGAGAVNEIANQVTASISGSVLLLVNGNKEISVLANDSSTIVAHSIGASLGAAASGATGVAIQVGVSVAHNAIANHVTASVIGSTLRSAGEITINSDQLASITSMSVAASAALAVANLGFGVAGAGALATNAINNQTIALVQDCTLSAVGDVSVLAEDQSIIDASILAATISLAVGNVGAAAAFGISLAENRIGDATTYHDNPLAERAAGSARVMAAVDRSRVITPGSLDVRSQAAGSATATVFAGSAAAAAGSIGASVAGAGVSSVNQVEMELIAAILNSNSEGNVLGNFQGIDVGGRTTVSTANERAIETFVGAATLAIAAGSYAGGVSVAVSDARAKQNNRLQAVIRSSVVNSGDGTILGAYDRSDVSADAYASAVAAALAPFGATISGGGVFATSEVIPTLDTEFFSSTLQGLGLWSEGWSSGNAVAQTRAVAISAGIIGIGLSGSSARAVASPQLNSWFTNNAVDVQEIRADLRDDTNAQADAAGLTISTGFAVGVSQARTETKGQMRHWIDSGDHVIRSAAMTISTHGINPLTTDENLKTQATAQGSAGGLLIGVNATVTSMESARVGYIEVADGSRIEVDYLGLSSQASSADIGVASSFAASLIAAGVTLSTVDVNVSTGVQIGEGVQIIADNAEFIARPETASQAHTVSGAAGGISGAVAVPSTNITMNATIEIGDRSVFEVTDHFQMRTTTESQFDATLLAAAGGLLSGGGGSLSNTVDANSQIKLGAATIVAGNLLANAANLVDKSNRLSTGTVDATTGGLIAGVGVSSTTDLYLTSEVTMGADITLDNLGQPNASISASNEIQALEETTLRSGGIAAGGINNSTLRTPLNNATVRLTDGASITAAGGIDICAGGSGDLKIQSNSETYGAATVGAGVATIAITPQNLVALESGAEIVAQRDVNLSAGTDTNFNQDIYNIGARVDTFAGSLIPIDLMDAIATLDQDNSIIINSGAAVRSGGDLRMHAEQFGDNNVIAQVKAVNWTTGVAGAIDGLFGAGGVEQFGGTATSNASGIVNVNGVAETGIARKRILEITEIERADPGVDENGDPLPDTADLFTVFVDSRSTGDITFEKRLLPVNSALDLSLTEAERQLDLYWDVPALRTFYEAEVTRLKAELEELGLLQTLVDDQGRSIQQRVVRRSLSLDVDPVYAKAGRIDVRAGSFIHSEGALNAPGDSAVEIVNQTPANLILRGIEVTEDAGGVFLNGQLHSGGEGGSTGKQIIVDNRFVVLSDNTTFSWPNITVSGPVTNLGGSILLQTRPSGAGSITINAPVNGLTQQILAGNNGNVVINLPELGSIYEASGAEHARWGGFTRPRLFGLPVGAAGTGRAEPGFALTDLFIGNNPDVTAYLATTPTVPSLIGSSIFISAQYVNVNGIIQSGKPEYKLTITPTTAAEITSLRSNSSLSGLVELNTVQSSDLLARYDVDRDRIVVEELRVSGGYVDLTGHITNTHNGEIRVLSDYAKIHIDNQIDIDIEVQRLDVSRRGEGTVIIKDLAGASREQPNVSIYRREGDVIVAETPGGLQTVPNGSNLIYLPQPGLRYGWTIAEERLQRTTTLTGSSSWLGMDWIAADPADVISTTTQQIGTPVITDAGPYFYVGSPTLPRYTYSRLERTISARNYTCCGYSETNWIGTVTYYNTFISEQGTRTLHTHTIDADRPIDIRFQGQPAGEILIESRGNVFIAGALNNPGGTTTIFSHASVQQGLGEGAVGGLSVQVSSNDGVGGLDAPLRTNVDETAPFDLRSDQIIRIDGIDQVPSLSRVNSGVRVRVAEGHSAGGVVGEVYRYLGARTELDLSSSNYSDETLWSRIELRSEVQVRAASNIYLHEIAGDLPIWSILGGQVVWLAAQRNIVSAQSASQSIVNGNAIHLISQTGSIGESNGNHGNEYRSIDVSRTRLTAHAAHDVYITSSGDITLDRITAGGDVRIDIIDDTLIDGNLNDVRDDRAIEEIAGKVWGDLQLTVDRGWSDKRDERVNALKSSQTQSYNSYWNFRETQVDPSTYDPNHRVAVSQVERDYYANNEETIAFIEARRTTQYHSLHSTWDSLGNERIDSFIYQPSNAELADIDSMKIWTDDELLNLRSLEFLNVTDTEFMIEEPNIIARTITLNVGGGVGSYHNGSTVELREIDGQPPVLTLGQQALITAAEPGDIVYLAQAPSEIATEIVGNGIALPFRIGDDGRRVIDDLGLTAGQRVFVEGNTRDTTDAGYFFTIIGIENGRLILDLSDYEFGTLQYYSGPILIAPVFEGEDTREAPFLRVLRREDVDVDASERVTVTSDSRIFLGSEHDLPIDRVHAGIGQRVQIKAAGAIYPVAEVAETIHIIGGHIVLESADDRIGSLENLLRVDSTGNGYLIARAENEVAIAEKSIEGQNNDVRVNQIFSQTATIQLIASGAILDALNSDNANLRAAEIILWAGTGIGSSDNSLEIDLLGDGTLTATAIDDIYIAAVDREGVGGNLNLKQVESETGDVTLVADAIKPSGMGVDVTANVFSFTGAVEIGISGAEPDSEYNRLHIEGTVDLTGTALILGGTFPGFRGTRRFTIVAATELLGEFEGLPHGSELLLQGHPYRIEYDEQSVALVSNRPASTIQGAFVYHSRSVFANSGVQEGLALGKTLALEGATPQLLTFDNLINTNRGINGLVFDIQGLFGETLLPDDLVVQISPQGNFDESAHPPSVWQLGPAPNTINVLAGDVLGGIPDRIVMTWPDNAIENRWLRITLLANENTGLLTQQVYYIGHLHGEVNGVVTGGRFLVQLADMGQIRAHVGTRAPIDSPYDLDKNSLHQMADVGRARRAIGGQLRVITIPASASSSGGSGTGQLSTIDSDATSTLISIADLYAPAILVTPFKVLDRASSPWTAQLTPQPLRMEQAALPAIVTKPAFKLVPAQRTRTPPAQATNAESCVGSLSRVRAVDEFFADLASPRLLSRR